MGDDEEESAGGGWLLSYADLMTLLFAAFVVLYGITPKGKSDDVLGVVSTIREAFIEIPDDIPVEEKKGPIKLGKAVFKQFRAETNRDPIIKKYRRYKNALPMVNQDMEQVKTLINMMSEKKSDGKKRDETPGMTVVKDDKGFLIRLVASKYFAPGEYQVNKKELRKLSKIGKLLKEMGRNVVIEGHTDSTPLRGKMTNWELSALRATHLLRYFVDTSGIPKEKIAATGYADAKPLVANDSVHSRQLNRRIEIKVRYDDN